MPEQRETAASGKVAKEGIKKALEEDADLTLEGIYADATAAEAKQEEAPERAQSGLVYELNPASTIVRGSESHQTSVYPEVMKYDIDNNYPPLPYPPSFKRLVLTGVQTTHRALILHLGMLNLMVSYLTHTSVQWYTRNRWDTGIMCVSKDVRKFHVGMALVFKEYVLAFVTIDLLFQPVWQDSHIHHTTDFLVMVAEWIQDENWLDGKRYVLACDAIRAANEVWYGIGVYTVMELFFLAGLSPFITACELFSNPSRTARFLVAYYTYIHVGDAGLWRLLSPCIYEGVLAPTTEQRLRYADWLYVWGKERVYMSIRMSRLLDSYNSSLCSFFQKTLAAYAAASEVTFRKSVTDLFDVFEPTLVEPALEANPTWGSLVFGEWTWLSISGNIPIGSDPITELFRSHGLLSERTHLRSEVYSPLYLPSEELKLARRNTFLYHGSKEMWSILRNFPQTLHWSSNPVLAVCKGDPSIPQHFEERVLRGLNRITTKLEAPGSRKRKRTAKENKALAIKLSTLRAGYQRASEGNMEAGAEAEHEPPKPKKRRLNADQRLALQNI
ncbi:hypothetical protein R3P38DRAFT_2912758 [Favolaschia claudopus]|uniref:Uncharacterized protein n=1 Tax=Favolaschia claudopus TaxID=2862362 RepID=A0AAW0CA37_9AGAR